MIPVRPGTMIMFRSVCLSDNSLRESGGVSQVERGPFGSRLEGLTEHGLVRSVIVPIVDIKVRPVGRFKTFGGRDRDSH